MFPFDWLDNKTRPEPDKRLLLLRFEIEIDRKLLETIQALMRVRSIPLISAPLAALWFLFSGLGVNVQSRLCDQPILPSTPQVAEDVIPQKGGLPL